MLTTEDSGGVLRSRPMATQQITFDGVLWFFTDAASHKVDEIHSHKNVNVTFVDGERSRYISVSGTAQVLRDTAKGKELWRPYLRAWFPQGPDSPEVALLKIKVQEAEYWDSPASKMVHLANFILGEENVEPLEHGKLTLTS